MTHTFVRALAFLAIFWACIVLASSRDPAPTGQLKSQQEQGHSRIDLHNTGFGATAESFDANARLTRDNTVDAATPAQSSDTRYTHDAVGNRSTKTSTTGGVTSVTTYSYDSADRLTQESTTVGGATPAITTYQWDANGNLAAKQEPGKATLYRFDPQNRLIDIRTGATPAAATAATASVSYAYDASGNRIKKATTSGATSYLMDSNQAYPQVALESSTTTGASPSTQSTAYVWGNQLIRQTRGSAASLYPAADAANDLFPLQGHLNTSLGAVDANGNLVEQTAGDAYGNLAQQTGLKQSHPYTGEYWDQDSQLLYLRARWYDPKVARFVSADPFEGKQRNPRSLNRYAYAHSDPVHNADPSGEMSLGETGAAGSIQGTLSSLALPNMARQGLEFARRAKIFDVYDYAMWPLHFYMYVERSGGAPRIRYDVGNGSGWGGMLRRNPFGVIPGGFVSASPVTNRSQNQGRSLKIVSLTFGQWLTWHVSVVGTEEQSCVIPRPYSLTPGMGTNCLSWTVWASAKALAISRLPL